MYREAVNRMELMGASYEDRCLILKNRSVDYKVVVNHEEKSVRQVKISDEELKMIRKYEAELGFICYYMIQDEGLWPDGCTFPRITLLYVDECEKEYEMVRDECIKSCGTVPAYVINMEDLSCSEFTEIEFKNMGELLINIS